MYLLLDLSIRDSVGLDVFGQSSHEHKSYSGENRNILFYVHQFLVSTGYKREDVQGIAVIMETGSFTSIRLAVTLANTWAYARQISVIGLAPDEIENLDAVAVRLAQVTPGTYISASYAAEPNIGPTKVL
ncbi:MAG: hypothetical protein COU35_00895 [Candidatus Magasanikbacteria bacterium CG10_big_fil_rev_8_21_14_0_10_47_10]|uniref:Gcp-like domain-containing protein n=1 Tax=Candidatus Magasanikbacteria bacterium CG10_big_fil_rev_8_21_14_0_10_47_10 TaxID=1974652 RepID=A0A2H0TRB0_9BACT|nr:MAG: hypothetical protein COU35_00895 [Candidatus Magasanikbacteria bacterium CG10_big_fil_rev_8_21_14_0_10_47_10]